MVTVRRPTLISTTKWLWSQCRMHGRRSCFRCDISTRSARVDSRICAASRTISCKVMPLSERL